MAEAVSAARRAFVLRIAPSGVDRVDEALRTNDLIIGWSDARGLTDPELDYDRFRQIIHDQYYATDQNFIKSGRAAGALWAFIREMHPGDLVVVPRGSGFHIAEVKGSPYYDEKKVDDDTAHRRPVTWLNNGKAIPRSVARLPLQLRMKARQTVAYAPDLVDEITDALNAALEGRKPSFDEDLHKALVQQTLKEIRSGRINDRDFERLIQRLLYALGARNIRIVPRNLDKGADVIATFAVANSFEFVLAVQAKHFQPDPPVPPKVIEDLYKGMQAESAHLGWVVTSGSISDDAQREVKRLEDQGIRIELIDGEELASMLIQNGLKKP